MKFWDSSALLSLLVDDVTTEYCLEILAGDHDILVWCMSRLEVMSTLCRLLREGTIGETAFQRAKGRLLEIEERAHEVTVLRKVRERASRLLEVHSLGAGKACQLAAALVATQEDPARLPMVCFDRELARAAIREGFVVNPGLDGEP